MKLNLGANDRGMEGFLSVDICEPADVVFDLSRAPWPWPDSSVEEIEALDVFEHLPNRIQTMNEAWRVMIPGGRLHVQTPNAAKGGGFAQDPTHCAPWTITSFKYFDPRFHEWQRMHKHYGVLAQFHVLSLVEWTYQDPAQGPGCVKPEPVFMLNVRMVAVKP